MGKRKSSDKSHYGEAEKVVKTEDEPAKTEEPITIPKLEPKATTVEGKLKILDELAVPSPIALLGQLARLANKLKPEYSVLRVHKKANVTCHFGNLQATINQIDLNKFHEERIKHAAADLILNKFYGPEASGDQQNVHTMSEISSQILKDCENEISVDQEWYDERKGDFAEKTNKRVDSIIAKIEGEEKYSDEVKQIKKDKILQWRVCHEEPLPYSEITEAFNTEYFKYLSVACAKSGLDFKSSITFQEKKKSPFTEVGDLNTFLPDLKGQEKSYKIDISIFKKSDKTKVVLEKSSTEKSDSVKSFKSKFAYDVLKEMIEGEVLKDVSRRTFMIRADHVEKMALKKKSKQHGKKKKKAKQDASE